MTGSRATVSRSWARSKKLVAELASSDPRSTSYLDVAVLDLAVAEYAPGDRDDFDRLYRESYPRELATLVAILGEQAAAEDCLQEAYVRAFDSWERWRRDGPAEAWLHRIALNVAFSFRRRERIRAAGELVRRLGRPAEPEFAPELRSELLKALRSLPPKQASAIVLRHLHGYSNREIGIALGIPERTVASRLAAAKSALRRALEGSSTPVGLPQGAGSDG